MSIVNLSKRTVGNGFEYTETIASGANGNTILIPEIDNNLITCTIIAGANIGKFQFSTSLDASVIAGTCTWQDWPDGSVTGTNSSVISGPITGLRGVSVSGEIVIEVIKQG